VDMSDELIYSVCRYDTELCRHKHCKEKGLDTQYIYIYIYIYMCIWEPFVDVSDEMIYSVCRYDTELYRHKHCTEK